jgi:hypothetical protein
LVEFIDEVVSFNSGRQQLFLFRSVLLQSTRTEEISLFSGLWEHKQTNKQKTNLDRLPVEQIDEEFLVSLVDDAGNVPKDFSQRDSHSVNGAIQEDVAETLRFQCQRPQEQVACLHNRKKALSMKSKQTNKGEKKKKKIGRREEQGRTSKFDTNNRRRWKSQT